METTFMGAYYVYILENPEGIYYKGYTTDLARRLEEHNAMHGKYTSLRGPWKLVYSKEYAVKRDALIEEKRIKRLNKLSLVKLIAG